MVKLEINSRIDLYCQLVDHIRATCQEVSRDLHIVDHVTTPSLRNAINNFWDEQQCVYIAVRTLYIYIMIG